MNFTVVLIFLSPFLAAILGYWLFIRYQMGRYQFYLRSDDFLFVKTNNGDVIRQGQTSRNRLALVFLGLVEIGLIAVIIITLQKNPIHWMGFGFSILIAVAIGGLMGYLLRLQRVPPMQFDSQSKVVRFEKDGHEQRVPFSEIRRIDMSFQHDPNAETQDSGTWAIVAYLTGVRSLPLAQISGTEKVARQRAQELVALIEEVTGVGVKPVADMTAKMKTIQDVDFGSFNFGMVAQHLGRIQQEGGSGNFVVFVADSRANYFIQFSGQKGDSGLYAEAAANPVIPGNYRLNQEKQSRLLTLGWEPPAPNSPNYHRQWQASSYDDRLTIAKVVMQTFVEVYGADLEQTLEVDLNLE